MSSGGPQHPVVAGGPSWVLVLNLLKPLLRFSLYNNKTIVDTERTRRATRARGGVREIAIARSDIPRRDPAGRRGGSRSETLGATRGATRPGPLPAGARQTREDRAAAAPLCRAPRHRTRT